MYMEDDDRFVKETGSIDKLTRDKLRGGPELPLKREKCEYLHYTIEPCERTVVFDGVVEFIFHFISFGGL